ncbi:MAG: radical SAM protein [Kiritimatiellae bacterium]|nr:radical SAM protein [Kiritimatiellia bacterium]MBQ3341307.1 radical SAM protein [Kiritimatiellia bacterium]
MVGRVFEIREFALHDGPGVRTTVFFKGCPLRCAWCHNPEGQTFDTETMVRRGGEKVVCGRDWTADALAEELLRNADIMAQSGGGVTFSGGEPLMQAKFLLELIPTLKRKGIGLAIETSGHAPSADYQSVVSQLDFVYQDVKLLDAAEFRRWTGGELSIVMENIAWLRGAGIPFAFRVPCVPGVNDSADARAAFEGFAAGARMEFLPFNNAAGAKYPLLGRTFRFPV